MSAYATIEIHQLPVMQTVVETVTKEEADSTRFRYGASMQETLKDGSVKITTERGTGKVVYRAILISNGLFRTSFDGGEADTPRAALALLIDQMAQASNPATYS